MEDGPTKDQSLPYTLLAFLSVRCIYEHLIFTWQGQWLDHGGKQKSVNYPRCVSSSTLFRQELPTTSTLSRSIIGFKHKLKSCDVVPGTRKVQCQLCPRTFASVRDLNGHIAARHDSSKKISCAHCGRQFSYHSALRLHQQTRCVAAAAVLRNANKLSPD